MKKFFTVLTLAAVACGAMAEETEDMYADYTVTPKQGEVTEMKSITVQFPGVYDVDLSVDDVTMTVNGLKISGLTSSDRDDNKWVVTLPETYTKPGEYILTIHAEAISGFDKSYEHHYVNEKAIILKWTIAGEVNYFDHYSVTPAAGVVTGLENVLLTFPMFEEVEVVSAAGISFTAGETAIEGVTYAQDVVKNAVKVTLPKLFTEEGEYVLTVPVKSLAGYHYTNDVAQENIEEIVVKWNVVAPVKYEYTLQINSPRPNDKGEISAEKSLSSIFLVCDQQPGLQAVGGDVPNVTMREVNGDYSVTSTLSWAYGLKPDCSYFQFKCPEPSFNGVYEIVIEKGAFGNAAWLENHEAGISNDRIVLTFTLVDGREREIYTIDAVSLTPEAGEYKNGSDIATFTLTYPEGVEAVKEAYATLGGVDVTDYLETALFVKNADGSYSVTFPAPTAQGTYKFSVDAGSFGDAAFVAGEAGGKGSKAIELDYKVLTSTAVATIEADADTDVVYNMQGVRVNGKSNALPAGLYIVNGKKVLKRR